MEVIFFRDGLSHLRVAALDEKLPLEYQQNQSIAKDQRFLFQCCGNPLKATYRKTWLDITSDLSRHR
jgi:hypothetical protein